MQAAVNRLPGRKSIRQGGKSHITPQLATADDAALLGALPIAAAIIGKASDGLKVLSYHERFREAVELSTCTKGLNNVSSRSAGIPIPVSRTSKRTRVPCSSR